MQKIRVRQIQTIDLDSQYQLSTKNFTLIYEISLQNLLLAGQFKYRFDNVPAHLTQCCV